jgi:hypothetical protein
VKKLALAIGLGAHILFTASSGSLAAQTVEKTAGAAADRDATIVWSNAGMNAQLYAVNQMFYPDTVITWDTDTTFCDAGNCLSR